MTDGVEADVEAGRLGARRRVGGQDEHLADPQPALGGQAAQPVEALLAERLVGPLGRVADRVRDAVGVRGERRGVVEVGDGDVGVALDDQRAVGLELPDPVDRGGRVGAVEDDVAGDEDRVGLGRLDRLRTAASATALPWTSEKSATRVLTGAPTRRG